MLAALLLVQVPVLSPQEQEVVVIGNRLKAFRGHWRSNGSRSACEVQRSSGDREVDAIGCAVITDCSRAVEPRIVAIARDRALNAAGRRAAMTPINAELGRCMQTRHDAAVTALADRRAAARAGAGS